MRRLSRSQLRKQRRIIDTMPLGEDEEKSLVAGKIPKGSTPEDGMDTLGKPDAASGNEEDDEDEGDGQA